LPQYFEISHQNIITRYIPLTRLWTQYRLAFECLINPPEILFVPAHTIPVIRRPSLKTIVTIHDLGAEFLAQHHQFPHKLYLNWSTKYVAKHATHIIAVSDATKKDLVKQFKVSPKRITVVHEAVNSDIYYPRKKAEVENVKKEFGLKKPYLLFVGTIQPRKNLIKLIEAFSKLKNKNLDLVISGKPGWLFEEIYAAPKKFGVENQVKFLGYVPEEKIPALYSGAEIFVYPSLYEGFGLPILEAMACGCPVLTSNTTSMPEVSGGNALLVNPKKTEEITFGIKQLLKNPIKRQVMAQKGLEWVKNFSWEKTAAETIAVFEKVAKG
jgi:glycosyltransferase involved in cell wall biosynthesis